MEIRTLYTIYNIFDKKKRKKEIIQFRFLTSKVSLKD